MKKFHLLIGFFAIALPIPFSCSPSDVYDAEKAKHTTDLAVPADFDWSTTRIATYSIATPVDTRVSIYGDRSCTDQSMLADIALRQSQPTEVTLELPKEAQAIYIQYPTATGTRIMTVPVTTTTRAGSETMLPEDAVSSEGGKDGRYYYYIPSKKNDGTLLFEDNYPNLGDYDMNDYVAYYRIESTIANDSPNPNMGADISLTIRAIGGTKPYRLALELPVLTGDVRNQYTVTSTHPSVSIELISTDDNQPAIFAVNGTNSLREGSFYNTEEQSSQSPCQLTLSFESNCYDDISKSFRFWALASSTSYNFFLQNTSTREEIHLKGYNTTHLASNPGTSFASADNFVWGIKVPEAIPHPKENIDIKFAFPHFEDWVRSGGENGTGSNWYKTSQNKGCLIH